ncbi:hypothetical protein [Sulfurimonas sp.]|uniref:hypothetical protein n=1 Tax=Sulfurimonas sp. TaxID=2022749 RepID=UPI003D125FA2
MKQLGKILFFNFTEGHGIIITSTKEKLLFTIEEWNDFEVMPELGLKVYFENIDGKIKNISLNEADIPTQAHETVTKAEDVLEQEDQEIEQEIEGSIQEQAKSEDLEEEEYEFPDQVVANQEVFDLSHEKEEHLYGIDQEYGEREESVTLTLNIKLAVNNYFNIINEHITHREGYKKLKGRLNYLLIRRFLWTMFNNLREIDGNIITPQIKTLSDDLKLMGNLYYDLLRKTKYPSLAYQEVFLACQDEYTKISKGAQDMMDKLSRLRTSEEQIGSTLKVRKEELSKNIDTAEFGLLQDELRSLNGTYVDIVHMMGELDERYKHDMELLNTFEKEYKQEFNALFDSATKAHKLNLLDILNAQAYLLDSKLWEVAKHSKAIKAYFQNSSIEGELNTKTYLKYYLDSLDGNKMNEETKKLYEVYDYLVTLHKDCILLVSSSAQDAMDYEVEMKKLGSNYEIKAFIDEKKALKWAIRNSIKVLIIEDQLAQMDADTFLKYYKRYVLIIPKIIILGKKPASNLYQISKLLPNNVSSKALFENTKELLKAKK